MTSHLARTRQTRLNITPVVSSPPSVLPSSSLSTTTAKRKRNQKRQTTLDFPTNIEMPTPVSVKDSAGSKANPQDSNESSSSDDDSVAPSGPYSTPFKRLQRRRTVYEVESEDENNVEDEKPESIGEPESTSDERMQSSPTKKGGAKRKKASVLDDFVVPDSDEEEDEEPIRTSSKKRRKAISETPASSDDEPIQISPQRSGKSKFRRSAALEASDDDEEDIEDPKEEPTRKRRRATALDSTKISSPNSVISEDDELKKELEDLQELEMSSQKSPTKNARDARKASLAQLRKARSVGVSPQLARRQIVVLSDSEHEEEEVEDYDETYGITFRDHELETEADREFIEEDDPNAEIGVPDIPLQFSKFATAKSSKLFRYVVEWMLQKRLNPKFEEKELYLFAFKRLGDEITALVQSYISTVWTPEFTFTLRARPEYSEVEMGDAERIFYPSCEACNRTNHPASWAIQFSKNAYDAKSLEEVERKNKDSHGRAIAPESKVFHLGRECAANARNAHPLVHWSYILYDHINEQWEARHRLKINGHWSTTKKTRKIARFVDKMQDEGQIKKLFIDFRNDIDVAREMKVEDW